MNTGREWVWGGVGRSILPLGAVLEEGSNFLSPTYPKRGNVSAQLGSFFSLSLS